MKKHIFSLLLLFTLSASYSEAQENRAQNPIIFADVPDMSMLRDGDTYYMSSTTMHMNPGIPVMKSKDLINWELVSYAYDTLEPLETLELENGKNTYGKGTWASCIRKYGDTFYLTSFAQTTNKTYIFTTKDIEKGPWKRIEFSPSLHDHTFVMDNGKAYFIYGGGDLRIVQLKDDLSGILPETEKILIKEAHAPASDKIMLPAEGSQLFKIDGKYYIFNICWPRGGMRTVVVHRSDSLMGPYEGKMVLQDKGVAQGGLVNTPDNKWYAYLFQDHGAVGRIPFLVPVEWKDGWPVLGIDGKVPMELDLPASKGLIPGIVASDNFTRKKGDAPLPLVWQWNHNPDNSLWSVSAKKGHLRLTTGRVDNVITQSKNILTQRTIGPVCSGETAIDVKNMKEGDFAGLTLFQKNYGFVGVKATAEGKFLVMHNASTGKPVEEVCIPLKQNKVYLKASCDFNNRKDEGLFYYSLDGKNWNQVGNKLKMAYTMPHFMGYRFGLFNYATQNVGGYVDFDYFNIADIN